MYVSLCERCRYGENDRESVYVCLRNRDNARVHASVRTLASGGNSE